MSSKELYIGNIDPDTKSQEIRDIFEQYGDVNRCEVKYGGSEYIAAFGFVGFESIDDAERAQRKEHGRTHRSRRLIVEFTKTTPGQIVRSGRFVNSDDRMNHGNSNGRDHSRSRRRDDSHGGYRRRRSPSYSGRSSRDRSSNGDRRQKRDRSRSSRDHKSSSKRRRSSSKDNERRSSHSHKNGNSKKD